MTRRSKMVKIFAAISLLVVALGVGGAAYWMSKAYPPSDLALQELRSDGQVKVAERDGTITFEPLEAQPSIGLIFYPGGGVDYRSYAPVLRMIAARGYFVVLVQAPLNLAFFDVDAAANVMEQFPEVEVWVVGGHSLGGVAAAAFAADHPDKVAGLVFLASYPGNERLRDMSTKVVSIYGTNDGLATVDQVLQSKDLLPADTLFVPIEGGNHSQFGSYGFQDGDQLAAISAEAQQAQVVDAVVKFFEGLMR